MSKLSKMLFILIVAAAILFRIIFPAADPPRGLSLDSSPLTDTYAYSAVAAETVLGIHVESPGIQGMNRPILTGIALIIFKLFGVGVWQNNLISVPAGVLSVILLFFIVRKTAGHHIALLACAIFATDYTSIMMSRLSHPYSTAVFMMLLSVFLYSKRDSHNLWLLLSIIVILFSICLLHPLSFIILFGIVGDIISRARAKNFAQQEKTEALRVLNVRNLLIVILFAVAVVLFILLVGTPSYFRSRFVAYGGLNSLTSIPYRIFLFGFDTRFIARMLPVAGFALLYLIIYFCRQKRSLRENAATVFVWYLIGGLFTLAVGIELTRLRFQFLLTPAFCVLAAFAISELWRVSFVKADVKRMTSIVALLLVFLFVHHHIIAEILRQIGLSTEVGMESSRIVAERARIYPVMALPYLRVLFLILPIVFSLLFVLLIVRWKHLQDGFFLRQPVLRVVTILAAVLLFSMALWRYTSFIRKREYTILAAVRSVAQLFPQRALFTGHAAQVVTVESRIRRDRGAISAFLNKDFSMGDLYPSHFTGTNDLFAGTIAYQPEVMERLVFVCKLYVRGNSLSVYRIADCPWYEGGEFEKAVLLASEERFEEALAIFRHLLAKYPENSKLLAYAGVCQLRLGRESEAVSLFNRAIYHNECEFDAVINLAYINTQRRNFDEAEKLFMRAKDLYGLQDRRLEILAEAAHKVAYEFYNNEYVIGQLIDRCQIFLRHKRLPDSPFYLSP